MPDVDPGLLWTMAVGVGSVLIHLGIWIGKHRTLPERVEELESSGPTPEVQQHLAQIDRRLDRLEQFQDALVEQVLDSGGALRFGNRDRHE